ncbi:VOC family protein [Flexivirga caeni]|uniref:Glyoxalase/bleomycin resistance/extradiol dioxygenase family protein n=1 Tax=Flexivirga caeni TaxID=2294115 RepID=A0A3M9M1R9_9MICO|nr:VOC family protein [Flexivirga caeni]RNI19514.1 glyoxalase/bleomycin resistance/extradiol dioxygenase family protein [Flexivirga caeni]
MHAADNYVPAGATALVGLRFELFVQDVATSVRFYRSTLGLQPPPTWSGDGYVSLRSGAITIGVQHHAKLPAGHHFSPDRLAGPRGVGLEMVVEVDDVDLAYANAAPHAESCGGSVEPLADQPWGLRDFRLVDPDGYYLRVTSLRRWGG